MEIGSAAGANVQTLQQPAQPSSRQEIRQADQQQHQAELENQRAEPDPNQRVGTQIDTRA